MRPIVDVLVLATAALLVLAYRRRRDRSAILAAATGAALVGWDLLRWPTVLVDVGARELALVVAVVVAFFNVVGFPRIFVRAFRVGYRSREWDFDMRLFDEKERLDRLLLEYRWSEDWDVYRRWRKKVLTRGNQILRTIEALKPPTPEWTLVRDGYVDLYDDILSRIHREEPPDNADTLSRGTDLKERAEILRIAYRTAAIRWMRGADRRRG